MIGKLWRTADIFVGEADRLLGRFPVTVGIPLLDRSRIISLGDAHFFGHVPTITAIRLLTLRQ